jgi:MYXO-CTERM domain-containing protein
MVGIEHVGFASEDDYLASMYETSADLVDDIAARNGVPLDRGHIVAHQEVPDGVNIADDSPPCPDSPGSCIASGNYGGAGHHSDPGVNWEWCQYMEMVGGTCKCNDTFDLWNCVHDGTMMNRCKDGVVEIVHCADTCVVEPIGTDDHCTPVGEGTGGAGGGAANGSGGSAANGSGGSGGSDGVGGGGADGATDDGCSCRAASAPGSSLAWLAVPALAGLLGSRRRLRASKR